MIPRIFHQIWVGPAPFPDEFATYQESWRTLHPGWELRLWTEDTLPPDARWREVYDRMRLPAERSDILRLEILWHYGGVYLDADFECRRPIDPLIDGVDFFCAYLKPGRVNNAILGATPAHPIVDRALRELRPQCEYGLDKSLSGPLFVNRLLGEYPEVKIFEPELFYPRGEAEEAHAVAIHHAARSWKDTKGFRDIAQSVARRCERAQAEIERSRRRAAALDAEAAAVEATVAAGGVIERTPWRERIAGNLAVLLHLTRPRRLARRARRSIVGRGIVFLVRQAAAQAEAAKAQLPPPVPAGLLSRLSPRPVPRIVHLVALGAAAQADAVRARRSWQRHNRGWSVRVWTDENLPPGLRAEAYEALRAPRERAEIIRLELLARVGGVAVDPSLECRRPLGPVLGGLELVAVRSAEGEVDAALLAAAPGHPVVVRAARELAPRQAWAGDRGLVPFPLASDAFAGRPDAALLDAALVAPANVADERAVAVRPPTLDADEAAARAAADAAYRRLDELRPQVEAARAAVEAAEARLATARARLAQSRGAPPASRRRGVSSLVR